MMLKEVFGNNRICALAGDKSTGKTNNLMALIKDFRKDNKKTKIYVFGLDENTLNWIKRLGNVFEVSSLEQLSNKKDSLIIIDEFVRLKLNDRRHKERLDAFVDFIYHHNNWAILSCPNLREYNSIIGSKIEGWLIKSLRISSLVNGSQLKDVILNYNGRFKCINSIDIEEDKILVINDDYEKVIKLEYIKEVDNKIHNVDIFGKV